MADVIRSERKYTNGLGTVKVAAYNPQGRYPNRDLVTLQLSKEAARRLMELTGRLGNLSVNEYALTDALYNRLADVFAILDNPFWEV